MQQALCFEELKGEGHAVGIIVLTVHVKSVRPPFHLPKQIKTKLGMNV